MFLYAFVAYLVAFKCRNLAPINFECYHPEVCANWSVFLSTDRLAPSVCVNECFSNLFFLLMILPTRLFYLCCAPPFVDAPTCEKKLRYFHIVDLNIGIN
jgi:hypothetical protein